MPYLNDVEHDDPDIIEANRQRQLREAEAHEAMFERARQAQMRALVLSGLLQPINLIHGGITVADPRHVVRLVDAQNYAPVATPRNITPVIDRPKRDVMQGPSRLAAKTIKHYGFGGGAARSYGRRWA